MLYTSSPEQISYVSFDIWKTLITSNPEFKPARNALIAEMAGLENTTEFSDIVRSTDVALDAVSDKTGIQYGPADRLKAIFQEMEVEVPRDQLEVMSIAAQNLFLEYPLQLNEPNLIGALENLRSRYKGLCLTSNTGFIDGFYMRRALEDVGIYQLMDAAFFSNEQNYAKPHAKMFRTVVDWSGARPNNIMHVGDNIAADYNGARNVGMHAVLLTQQPMEGVLSAPTIEAALQEGIL